MSGHVDASAADILAAVVADADTIVTSTSAADVRPNTQTFTSNTLSVVFQMNVGETFATWQNNLIKAGHVIQLTDVDNVRLRLGYDTIVSDGSVVIRRSSGSIDESMCATLGGVT